MDVRSRDLTICASDTALMKQPTALRVSRSCESHVDRSGKYSSLASMKRSRRSRHVSRLSVLKPIRASCRNYLSRSTSYLSKSAPTEPMIQKGAIARSAGEERAR